MASVFPFRAWHPRTGDVKKISCPPYDVINSDEARKLAKGNAQSFLHVIRPEIDLDPEIPFNDKQVYAQGAENLQNFFDKKLLVKEKKQNLFLYQQEWQEKIQTGLFCCVSVDEYDNEIILKHELTRPVKEDDRTEHIVAQQAHAEPVMLTYNETSQILKLQKNITENDKPLFNFEAPDGVRHSLWRITDAGAFANAFKEVDRLYIADGHHRCKSASRAAHQFRKKDRNNHGSFNYFPAVIFPSSQMQVLAYNRLVHRLPENFLTNLYNHFEVDEGASPSPNKKGDISIYLNGKWLGVKLPETKNTDAVENLDVYRLQKFILEPFLNINDQRRDKNISFVGGIRGTDELENKVNTGQAELAISLFPTAIEELMSVSDGGHLMPPKSTWFEPKLRSGLLIHTF